MAEQSLIRPFFKEPTLDYLLRVRLEPNRAPFVEGVWVGAVGAEKRVPNSFGVIPPFVFKSSLTKINN